MNRISSCIALLLLLCPSATALAGAGGPDAFGYAYTDSLESSGPGFAWEDIAIEDNLLPGVSSADDGEEAVALSFSFPFYGVQRQEIFVSSNGTIFFEDQDFTFSNNCLPAANETSRARSWGQRDTKTHSAQPRHARARSRGAFLWFGSSSVALRSKLTASKRFL